MRICICDDNEVMHQEIRKCLQPFFTEADMPQITDFFQGEELVEHYSSQKDFDIILTVQLVIIFQNHIKLITIIIFYRSN